MVYNTQEEEIANAEGGEKQYQGVMLLRDPTEGPCIAWPPYTVDEKDEFDADVEAGRLPAPDGREIAVHLWLDEPVSEEDLVGKTDGVFSKLTEQYVEQYIKIPR